MEQAIENERAIAPDGATPREYETLGLRVWILGSVMALTALVTLILMLGDFTSQSYLYLAFYSIPANTAISVFPHEPVLIYYGTVGNIWLAATAASAGTLVAGILDHAVFVPVMNLKSINAYKSKPWYQKLVRVFMRYPFWTLVATGFTPIPFFPFKFLSFSIHYPLRKYLSALLIARFPRYVLLAWLGKVLEIPAWLLIAVFGIIIIVYAVKGVPLVFKRYRAFMAARESGPAL